MENRHGVSRRAFVSGTAAAVAGALAWPGTGRALDGGTIRALPEGLPSPDAQEFWRELRREFLIPPDEAFFNTGTLGSSPRVVRDAVIEHMLHVDRDIAHWDYKPDHEQYFTGYAPETWVRDKLARLINAQTAEVALTQNATFGMNFVANGLELAAGDEVVVMEGAHPGGRCGWELREKRDGVKVTRVRVPQTPQSPRELIAAYEAATTPRTRVWAIPHLTSGTAILFPVQQMCARARERGIVSVIDGAQTLGHFAIDVRAMGCDVFFSSPHKWLLAPKGTGLLFVRADLQPRVWSTLASTEWDNHEVGAYRLMQYGTGNLSLLKGLEKAIDFHADLDPARVQARIIGLADRLRAGLRDIPRVEITSPQHPELKSATTVWRIDGIAGGTIQDELWSRSKVRVRSVGAGVRQCCHIYNLEDEVDRTLTAVRALVA